MSDLMALAPDVMALCFQALAAGGFAHVALQRGGLFWWTLAVAAAAGLAHRMTEMLRLEEYAQIDPPERLLEWAQDLAALLSSLLLLVAALLAFHAARAAVERGRCGR